MGVAVSIPLVIGSAEETAEVMENVLCGPQTEVLVPLTGIGQWLFHSLQSLPSDFTVVTEAESGKTKTAEELLQGSISLATCMAEMGVTKGDTVVMIGENTIELYVAGLATLFLGAVMSPVDPTLKSIEFQHIVSIIQPKVVFCDEAILSEVHDALEKLKLDVEVIVVEANENYEGTSLRSLLSTTPSQDFSPVEIEDQKAELAVIVCSSGTTGMPKGVGLSHYALAYQTIASKTLWEQKLIMQTSYFYWISGVLLMIGTSANGVPRVLVRTTEAEATMRAVEQYKPNLGVLTPSLLGAILHHPKINEYDLTSLDIVYVGGAPLNQSTVSKYIEKLPQSLLCQGYGCSELSGLISAAVPPTDVLSLGKVLPNMKVKVIEKNTGKALGPENEGEIVCKSPCLMNGYVRNTKATEEAIDDGWYHTGDIGKFTSEGVLYLTGRAKELMKVDGHQISPEEIEAVIALIPGVLNVAVSGITVGENNLPMALVVKEENSDLCGEDIIKVVQEKLSEFKQLRAGVHFVVEIPQTSTGKLKRRFIQEMAEALYNG